MHEANKIFPNVPCIPDTAFLGIPAAEIGTHSFRIGMASMCGNLGYEDSLVQVLGRWKSDCFKLYMKLDPAYVARAVAQLARV